ncbi:DUF5678 domain-containing protein [Dehalococcoidia bacterium]|nr:DUF5678 domain-containing protein [Dehalococcoidia bacterium]
MLRKWCNSISGNMKKTKTSIKGDKKRASLDKYAGEWVAFANGKVIAHGGTLKRLIERVKKLKRFKKPSVLLGSRKVKVPMFYEKGVLLPEKRRPSLSADRYRSYAVDLGRMYTG